MPTDQMRLLFCNFCKSLEEIPDYDGPEDVDPMLEELVMRHNVRDPMAHGGVELRSSPMRVAVTTKREWATDRAKVIKRVNEENLKVGFDAWVSEAVNTYAEDAMHCYRRHHRPEQGCVDWWSDSKRIGRPTPEGRAVVRESYKLGQSDPHLCQWCPVATFVQTEINFRKGLYSR